MLEHEDLILVQVFHPNGFVLLEHIRMLENEQPPTVGEEEASFGVDGVAVRVAVLVMYPVNFSPTISAQLETDSLQKHKNNT